MKLSQLFSGDAHAENVARPQLSPAQAANMSRQIRALVPGQTISGEVLSKNGGEVQIKVSEDLVLNARVDRNMNIEVGKSMTFEVKNNGSSLTLSPLFTNVSTDINVLKALDMAGLPVNRTSVSMTEQLMQAGLSVNKSMLQQVFREINSFPMGEISDVITLHRLQLPVNEANMQQMAAYRNMNHQLIQGMDTVLEALPEVFRSLAQEKDLSGAMRLYRDVLMLVQEDAGAEPGAGPGQAPAAGSPEAGAGRQELSGIGRAPEGDAQTASGAAGTEVRGIGTQETAPEVLLEERAAASARASMAEEALGILDGLGLPEQATQQIRARLLQFSSGQGGTQEFLTGLGMLAEASRTSEGAMASLERLFSGHVFRELLAGQFKSAWTLSPEEVGVPGRVEEMYRCLDRQLRGLSRALESAGHTESAAFRAVTAMSQNVDFLQQVNQMYAYVQLPLRLQRRDAHGELYVYTNKRKLTDREGTVSALLHLDMEHLGPVDVYVTMRDSKVNTRFSLRDDEMIDFMAAHMDILTQRLKKRGYECSCSMSVREDKAQKAKEGGLAPILQQDRGVVISQYAFDVRT